LVLNCFSIQCFEETKDCSLEGSKKEQQIGNRYHPGWIDRFSEIQGGIIFIIKRYLGQATRPLCKGRQKEEEEEEEEVEANYNISDFKEENGGQFFCFNCEGVGHVEFECPHPKIERNDTE
jgi:hypothetical protein